MFSSQDPQVNILHKICMYTKNREYLNFFLTLIALKTGVLTFTNHFRYENGKEENQPFWSVLV